MACVEKCGGFLTEPLILLQFKPLDRSYSTCPTRAMLESQLREIEKPVGRIVVLGVRRNNAFEPNLLTTDHA
ncbi:hypothetical protein D2V84_15635 [Burkholderia pseudomallei]|nr:hypothetical protein D2W72_22185 [Burkholderia pseudomallei]RIV78581.1 hypothetical protein D2V84_15635 [Burkholderia pseudomallei]